MIDLVHVNVKFHSERTNKWSLFIIKWMIWNSCHIYFVLYFQKNHTLFEVWTVSVTVVIEKTEDNGKVFDTTISRMVSDFLKKYKPTKWVFCGILYVVYYTLNIILLSHLYWNVIWIVEGDNTFSHTAWKKDLSTSRMDVLIIHQ